MSVCLVNAVFHYAECCEAEFAMLNVIMLGRHYTVCCYAECHYATCCFADFCYAECHHA